MIFVGKTRSHPFRTPAPQRATPNGVNLLAAPLTTATQHIWLDQEGIFTLPLYRLAGITSVANAEFSTKPFELPDLRTHRLWLNADVSWDRSNSAWDGGGCDESCAGYLMVEMLDAATGAVLRPKECIVGSITIDVATGPLTTVLVLATGTSRTTSPHRPTRTSAA